jgi:hypothetical protein
MKKHLPLSSFDESLLRIPTPDLARLGSTLVLGFGLGQESGIAPRRMQIQIGRAASWAIGALLRRSLAASTVAGRVDEREMAERLREVPHLTLRARIVLLREQPDMIH